MECCGFDTETFDTVFSFDVYVDAYEMVIALAISQCKTRCYLACWRKGLLKVALPGGEVLRKIDDTSYSVFACGGVVVSKGDDGVSVYDEDLTLLRSLSHEGCREVAVSDCGGWVITSSSKENNARLWDVNTGEAVACVPTDGWQCRVALSRSASVFAVEGWNKVQLFDWSGAALRSVDVREKVEDMQFTPCGKYLVVGVEVEELMYDEDIDDPDGSRIYPDYKFYLHQYDVATMSCVRVMSRTDGAFAISPCSRVVMLMQSGGVFATQHLYPHTGEQCVSGEEGSGGEGGEGE